MEANKKTPQKIFDLNSRIIIAENKDNWIIKMLIKSFPNVYKTIIVSMNEYAKQAWNAARETKSDDSNIPEFVYNNFNEYLDSLK